MNNKDKTDIIGRLINIVETSGKWVKEQRSWDRQEKLFKCICKDKYIVLSIV